MRSMGLISMLQILLPIVIIIDVKASIFVCMFHFYAKTAASILDCFCYRDKLIMEKDVPEFSQTAGNT